MHFPSISNLCPLLNSSNKFPLALDIARWASLSIQEKVEFYCKHACHELHLFLHAHDTNFFNAHVVPVISNRLDLDFMDLFLTGRDISHFATVERCSSLNVCEKIILARAIGGRTGEAIALDVARRCSALDIRKLEWADNVRLNAAMSLGVFSRGLECKSSSDDDYELSRDDDAKLGKEHKKLRELGANFEEENFFFGSAGAAPMRQSVVAPVLYPSAGKVRHIAEQRWKKIPQLSVFFREVALHTAKCISCGTDAPFLTPYVSTAGDCALVALAFISLPLSTTSSVVKLQRRTSSSGISSVFLNVSGLCLRYFKDTVEIAPPPESRQLIVGQHILESVYDPGRGLKNVTVGDQGCIIGRPYTLRTIVTNVTDKSIHASVLTQIPSSSMPLYGCVHTNVKSLKVPAFSVEVIDDWFFFPTECSATVYPAQVASAAGNCIGCAVPIG
jgi:hypothetical protein